MKLADVMVGNSSSGIIEAPSLGLPVVNVGQRQAGRPRAANVIDVSGGREPIERAIKQARGAAFRERARRGRNPYDGGHTSERVAQLLLSVELTSDLRRKRFVDPRSSVKK
jgi:UDP-N-acetylglucosamine 2-epimerase (non-hydrolysing)/GDP/UDP-N,N'-diacetylbacillosamine 2-epimerase (hydrolysing)